MRDLWLLDDKITFLNHGSFGACPKAVLEEQSALRERLEREPVRFMAGELEGMLDSAREALGAFVSADPEGIAFVPNATTAVNTVLRSLKLGPGDEILTTNHAYPSCRNAIHFISETTGARPVIAEVPFPIGSPDDITDRLLRLVTGRTKICVVDHVTSPTALIFPVSTLVRELKTRGIPTLIDGAHAPGMLPLNVEEVGAAYYTGNCHKWLCAPKGAAFLHVDGEKRDSIHPLSISLGAGSGRADRPRFHLEFDWVGTDDPTAYLCVPEAIEYMGSLLPGGWPELMTMNRRTALRARETVCNRLGISPPCPDGLIGSMASMPLPDGKPTPADSITGNDPIHRELFDRFNIEVPVMAWPNPPKRVLRISAQVYNTATEYERLAAALAEILERKKAGG
jgi:isopenicillin-N epimerase